MLSRSGFRCFAACLPFLLLAACGGKEPQAKANGNAAERPIPVTTRVVQPSAWNDTLQALGRCHPTVPVGPGRPALVEFEYDRGGTLAYLAAWDVHHANLFDRVEPKTGIEPFGRLVEQVMTTEPYASARHVYWIVDNGGSHAGRTSIARMRDKHQHARLIHLPIHASWLNQIELYFSIVQRKALTPNDFPDLDALSDRLLAFGDYYRQIARPFDWTFTRHDLDRLLARIADREPHLRLAA